MVGLSLIAVGISGSLVMHGRGPDASPLFLLIGFTLAAVVGGGLAIHALIQRKRQSDLAHAVVGLFLAAGAAFFVFILLSAAAETRQYIENRRKAAEQKATVPD